MVSRRRSRAIAEPSQRRRRAEPVPRPGVHRSARGIRRVPRPRAGRRSKSGPRTGRTKSSSRSCRPSAGPAARPSGSPRRTPCTRCWPAGPDTHPSRGSARDDYGLTPNGRGQVRGAAARHRLPVLAEQSHRHRLGTGRRRGGLRRRRSQPDLVMSTRLPRVRPRRTPSALDAAARPGAAHRLAHHEQGLRPRRRPAGLHGGRPGGDRRPAAGPASVPPVRHHPGGRPWPPCTTRRTAWPTSRTSSASGTGSSRN